MKTLIAILFIFFVSCTSKARIVYCLDGDTIVTSSGEHLRLSEIDAVEISQPYGIEAKNYLSSLILNKEVKIRRTGTDKYDRTIAQVFYKDEWINEKMVTAGYAYAYKKFSSDKLYSEARAARKKKIGIWKAYSVAPFIWRKLHHR